MLLCWPGWAFSCCSQPSLKDLFHLSHLTYLASDLLPSPHLSPDCWPPILQRFLDDACLEDFLSINEDSHFTLIKPTFSLSLFCSFIPVFPDLNLWGILWCLLLPPSLASLNVSESHRYHLFHPSSASLLPSFKFYSLLCLLYSCLGLPKALSSCWLRLETTEFSSALLPAWAFQSSCVVLAHVWAHIQTTFA